MFGVSPRSAPRAWFLAPVLVLLVAFVVGAPLVGCGGAAKSTADHGAPVDSGVPSPPESDVDASVGGDGSGGGASGGDANPADSGATPPVSDDAGGPPAPRNPTCTPTSEQTGMAVNTTHGRLDGTLVYVLPVGGSGRCNGDDSHVHLQIEVSGLVYDVAVDIGATGDEVGTYEETMTVPGGAWAEGWHGADTLAYPTLGLKSAEFPTADPMTVASQVESLLESTSKISIFCTGYTPQDNGCHDVHYENGNGEDGAIVLDPTAATSPILFFRFQGQSF